MCAPNNSASAGAGRQRRPAGIGQPGAGEFEVRAEDLVLVARGGQVREVASVAVANAATAASMARSTVA
ncbi:hypothetical protein [Actinocrispum sp. NPDC049592]|uniref:hypothetical protein n=1 Tax=Actinocrispum sp. NPDC049592 TaxID=3154835 RepID=UPI0034457C96